VWSTALLWLAWVSRGHEVSISDFPSLVLLPITFCFVATTAYVGGRRTTSQRILLAQQATIVKEAFDRARRQEAMLDEVLNAVEFGVIAFDRNGEVTLMNDAHRRSLADFNAPRSAVIHPIAYQADRVTPYPQHNRPFARAIAGQSFDNLTFWVGTPGERQVAYSVASRHMTTPDGRSDGGVIVLRDVTAELEAIRARDTLIGSVSHELRSPLTSILGYLELALDDESMDPDTKHMIEISHRNSERLLALVTDLLLAASDADKTLPIAFQKTDVVEIVAQAVDSQRLAADERSITIHADLPATAITSADPLRIRQVVDNLLTNAIKYNREGGEIFVTVAEPGEEIVLSVRDTGYGISESDLSQLFDRFFRTESARESTAVGSGLGLSITRDIIRQHGGELSVSSVVDVGTTFTMTIPIDAVTVDAPAGTTIEA
jgi:signal transduction histidine kinase